MQVYLVFDFSDWLLLFHPQWFAFITGNRFAVTGEMVHLFVSGSTLSADLVRTPVVDSPNYICVKDWGRPCFKHCTVLSQYAVGFDPLLLETFSRVEPATERERCLPA